MRNPALALLAPVLASALSGCATKIDKITVKRVVARAMLVPDVGQACQIGASLRSPLAAATREARPAHQALLIAEVTAGMCDEMAAWEHELDQAIALSEARGLPPAQRALVAQDARLQADRAHTRAATRYLRAYEHGVAAFGPLGTAACPKLKQREELPYLLSLVAGLQVVLHDSAAGSPLGVPKATILDVARGARCVDDAAWWYGPSAMQAAAWGTIPGSAPDSIDPWVQLDQAARGSDSTGVRVARGLQVTIAVNAGRDDLVQEAIRAHAAAIAATEADPRFALFDRYAYLLSRHQSDLIWAKEAGHRTPVFGVLPGDAAPQGGALDSDPFGADPFGADPFGDESTGGAPVEDAPPAGAPPTDDADAPAPGEEDE